MISYFCYFGGIQVGAEYKRIIFGREKLNRLFESYYIGENVKGKEVKVLIRYFVDGEVTRYDQIVDSNFFNPRDNAFVFNFRIQSDDENSHDINRLFEFIRQSTIESVNHVISEMRARKMLLRESDKIHNDIESGFEKILLNNVLGNK